MCGVMEIVNELHSADGDEARLMPRTEELALYTTEEFNDKVRCGDVCEN